MLDNGGRYDESRTDGTAARVGTRSRRDRRTRARVANLIGGRKAMAQSTPESVVYVSNAGSKEVFALAMNRATGALDLIEKTPVPGTNKPSPASLPMATSPDKRFLYAQLRSEPYPVSTFAIDRTTGRLKHMAATPLVNKNVYVPVLGADIVIQLKFDATTGTVSPNGPGEVATKSGAGPRHLTFHPNGKFAYLITETTATIGTFAVDPTSGTLKELQFVETNEYEKQPAASDIHVTPDGRFLYGAERRTSMLIGYKIDPDKGTLTQIGRFPTEKTPRGFAIDPRGKFLLSVGMDSAGMTV